MSTRLSLRAAFGLVLLFGLLDQAESQGQPCGTTSRHFDATETPVAPVGSGRVFYVNGRAGKDLSDGLSESTAFRTIARAMSVGLAPGDTVRIRAGRYRERLSINRSGTASKRIVVGAFGDGPVVIDASPSVSGWGLVSGNVYAAPVPFPVTAVVVDDVPLFPEFSKAALKEGRWYYDGASKKLFLWCPQGGSPASRDVGIVPDDAYKDGIVLQAANFVTLYGLTVRFAGGHGVSILGDHVRVEKCRLRFNGKAGVSSFRHGTTSSTHAEILQNEVYHNMLRNWPRGRYKWGAWASGVSSNGTPDVLYQGNVVYRNGGEGLGIYGGSGGVIRDNVSYDNWSVNIYVDNRPNVVVENNFVYSHTPDPADLYNNGDPDPSDKKNLRRLRPEGIVTGDEKYGYTPPASLANITIANNVIVNCRRGIGHYAQAEGSGLKKVRVLHNTIVVPAPIEGESTLVGIGIPYNEGNNVDSAFRNNIVYASHAGSLLLDQSSSPSAGDSFKGLTIDNNLWFHASRTDALHWGPGWQSKFDYTLAKWKTLPGRPHGAHDVFVDPQFVDALSIDKVLDKRVLGGSAAVGLGAALGVDRDYSSCIRSSSAPTIGGFEGSLADKPTRPGANGTGHQAQTETAGNAAGPRVFTDADLRSTGEPARQPSAGSPAGSRPATPARETTQKATGGGSPPGGTSGSPVQGTTTPTGAGQGSSGSATSSASPNGSVSERAAPKPRVFTDDDLLSGGNPSGRDSTRGTLSFPGDSNPEPSADLAPPPPPSTAPARTPSPEATPTATPAPPAARPYFPPPGPWYRDLSTAPLDPESTAVVRYLQRAGWGTGTMRIDFSIEVLNASATTPNLPFVPTSPLRLPECDYVPVPIPGGGMLEGERGYTCTTEGACRLIVVDRGRMRLFEMWRADIRNGVFTGSCLAVWDMTRRYPASGRGDQCRSADEAGYPIAPLLFTADEVAAGKINHAIRFVLPRDRVRHGVYVRPATHAGTAGGPVDSPPYGTRLRLRASYPVATLPAGAQVVARAMQKYGMLLADGGDITLTAQSDRFTTAKWSGLLGTHDLSRLKPEDFEMVAAGPRIPATGDCARNP